MAKEYAKMCTNLPDERTAKKISLSLLYTAFEHNNTVPNDTKINTTLTAKRPVPSKKAHSQSPNTTDEADSPKTSAVEPYINSTDQITTTKRAILLSKSTPTTQANLTKTNSKAEATTEKQKNATSEVKSVASLKPTTGSILNQNNTSQDQLSTKLGKTSSPDVAGHLNATANRPVVNATAIFNKTVTRTSLPASVNLQDQLSTKQTKTPQLNVTSAPNVGHVNATASRPVVNVTSVFNMTVTHPSFSASANCSNSTSANCNKAPNTKMNGLVVLVISILSIWMWQ